MQIQVDISDWLTWELAIDSANDYMSTVTRYDIIMTSPTSSHVFNYRQLYRKRTVVSGGHFVMLYDTLVCVIQWAEHVNLHTCSGNHGNMWSCICNASSNEGIAIMMVK